MNSYADLNHFCEVELKDSTLIIQSVRFINEQSKHADVQNANLVVTFCCWFTSFTCCFHRKLVSVPNADGSADTFFGFDYFLAGTSYFLESPSVVWQLLAGQETAWHVRACNCRNYHFYTSCLTSEILYIHWQVDIVTSGRILAVFLVSIFMLS